MSAFVAMALGLLATPPVAAAAPGAPGVVDAPHAVEVIEYDSGTGAAVGFTNPNTALGEPTRFTGVGIFPSVVSPFSAPFMSSEIVSIGLSGHLTLRLGTPAVDDPTHLFGVDLIVFANPFFIDLDFPNGVVGSIFGAGQGTVEVSDDGEIWHVVPDVAARDAFPPLGYLDSGPFDSVPGSIESDFRRPVDPSIDPKELFGLDYAGLLAVYDGSGGGTGIDLATVGLATASYVRFSVAPDARGAIAIDAVTVVIGARPGVFGDLNADGVVDGADLGLLLQNWLGDGLGDLNDDGVVDGADLGLLLQAWTAEG